MTEEADPGLVAGLEIHQQLDTPTKLFCACPTRLRDPDDAVRVFYRYLHPTKSELGEIDAAALEESKIDRRFEYLAYESTCLVEEDEEPPHRLNPQAIDIALEVAAALEMSPVDQAHVMRKIVVDGSNTSGFQRTTKLATDGVIETSDGPVGIVDLMLEEESAQRVETLDDGVRYSLDRLGIPLLEIGTAPDITSPSQAREVAEQLGMVLRSTRAVKRGLGSIRQDVNISIDGGARVEIKGVQELDAIEELIENEIERQQSLIELRDRLQERNASVGQIHDVSAVFAETDSSILRDELDADGVVRGVLLEGFADIVGETIQPGRRLGSELADHARRHGVDGLFHTDELPGYGITADEVDHLRAAFDADETDAVAIVAGDETHTELAIEAVAERARTALEFVPEETRGANEDGTSRYLRPLPGAARMYPETDVPPVELDMADVSPPELLTETVSRYQAEYDLDQDVAEQVAYGANVSVFETAVEDLAVDPTLAAQTVTGTLTQLRRDGVAIDALTDRHILEILDLHASGTISSDGIEALLEHAANQPDADITSLAESAGLTAIAEDEVRSVVESIVEEHIDQVEAEGMGAFSALMGECMQSLRGRAEGELVSAILREELQKHS